MSGELGAAGSLEIRHLLPQRHCHHDHEEEAERGLHDGGGSGHGGGLGSPGGGGRGRVGVGVAARAGQGRVILVRAAKLAVSHVPAGLVRHAGELLQLGEVVAVAAVGAVAASSVGTCWRYSELLISFLLDNLSQCPFNVIQL